jgi:hypothetical protein
VGLPSSEKPTLQEIEKASNIVPGHESMPQNKTSSSSSLKFAHDTHQASILVVAEDAQHNAQAEHSEEVKQNNNGGNATATSHVATVVRLPLRAEPHE